MNSIETCIFFIWFIHYLHSVYATNPRVKHLVHVYANNIKHIVTKMYLLLDAFFIRYNQIVYPSFWEEEDDKEKENEEKDTKINI